MRNLRNGIGKTDVRDVAGRVEEITHEDNDAAVCCVLRWASRSKAGPTAAVQECSTLGLDLHGALVRARAANRAAA
jgi:hypothetical protein